MYNVQYEPVNLCLVILYFPIFPRKCDHPKRPEPEKLPHLFTPTRHCEPGSPGHPAVPQECYGSAAC